MPRKKGVCSVCGKATSVEIYDRCAKHKKNLKTREQRDAYRREWHLGKKYGLEPGEFDAFWIVFRGKCAICKSDLKMPERRRGQGLDTVAVDHDHATGKVRGLLCSGCNKGLGLFKDSPQLLKQAKEYLEL